MQSTRDASETPQDSRGTPGEWPVPVPARYRPRTREDWQREHEELFAWIETQPDLAAAHRAGRELDEKAAAVQQEGTAARRALILAGLEPVTDDGTWVSHLLWLHREFGDRGFFARTVQAAALSPAGWVPPPGPFDPEREDFTTRLGLAYARRAHREDGGVRLVPGGRPGGIRRFSVQAAS